MILRAQFAGSCSTLPRRHFEWTSTTSRWSQLTSASTCRALPSSVVLRGQALRAITGRLLLKCHPDYFVSVPKKFRRNTRSLQELLGLLDAAFPVSCNEDEPLVAPCGLRTEVIFDLRGRQPPDTPVIVVFDVPAACGPEAVADIVQDGVLTLAQGAGVRLKPKESRIFAALATQRSSDEHSSETRPGFQGGGSGGGEVSSWSDRRAEAEQMLRNHEYNNTKVKEKDELEEVVAQLFFAPELADPDDQQAALRHLASQLPQLRRKELWQDVPLVVGVESFSGPMHDHGGWLSQGFLAIPAAGWTAADFLAYAVVAAPVAKRASRRRRDYGD
jgi:hypothetical protein